MRLLLTALAASCALLLSGCGGDAQLEPDVVAEQVSKSLGESVGFEPDDVTCPDPLPAEVGAEGRCSLTHQGETYGVDVEVTEVDGSDVRFDVEVDQTPQ